MDGVGSVLEAVGAAAEGSGVGWVPVEGVGQGMAEQSGASVTIRVVPRVRLMPGWVQGWPVGDKHGSSVPRPGLGSGSGAGRECITGN